MGSGALRPPRAVLWAALRLARGPGGDPGDEDWRSKRKHVFVLARGRQAHLLAVRQAWKPCRPPWV